MKKILTKLYVSLSALLLIAVLFVSTSAFADDSITVTLTSDGNFSSLTLTSSVGTYDNYGTFKPEEVGSVITLSAAVKEGYQFVKWTYPDGTVLSNSAVCNIYVPGANTVFMAHAEKIPDPTPVPSPDPTPTPSPSSTPDPTPAPVMPSLSGIHATPITYGQTLGNSTVTGTAIVDGLEITGTFAFSDPNGKPTVSDSESSQFPVVFTPDDTSKYKSALGTTTIHVNKADSSISFSPATGSISVYYPNKMKFTALTNNTEGVLKAVSNDDDIKSISAVSGSGYNRTFEIVPKGTGHADITVSVAETANYKAASATYTVYIKDSTGIEYTVQFHKNGDGSYWTNSNYPSYVKTQGHKISASRVPGVARPGWYFAGWYTAPTGGSRIYFTHEFTYDTDLYAHWSTVPVTGYEDHIWLWCGTLAIGLIGIWTSLSMRSGKRKRKHEKD